MILGDALDPDAAAGGRATIDGLFRRGVARRPDAVALIDPFNRQSITGDAPRSLTYRQADLAISGIAGRLRRFGLPTDTIVGVQLANTIESVLTLLGVLRAGMIPTLLPLLWRQADLVTALGRLGAKALIVNRRIGNVDHSDLAMHVAAEIFSVRYVCGFGPDLPDGFVPFDDLFLLQDDAAISPVARSGNPAAHIALVTWDVSAEGLIPVARNHMQLLAGGLAVLLESRIEPDAVILASPLLSSFSGVALTLLPWLFSSGTLVLHHPFNPYVFAAQCEQYRCGVAVLPGPLVPVMADGQAFAAAASLKTVVAAWRAPERLPATLSLRRNNSTLIDVLIFGETGICAARRSGIKAAPVPFGPVMAPRDTPGSVLVADIQRTDAGTVALSGPMVPREAFPPGAERAAMPHFRAGGDGRVDTGYRCRIDRDTQGMVVTGAPPGMIGIGGARFGMSELQDLVKQVDGGGGVAA